MENEAAERVALLRGASAAASRVFTAILTRSPISRIDIAKSTGLSQAAVTKAVTPLVNAGLVDDRLGTQKAGAPGRPVSPVAVVPAALATIGVKINVDELIGVATDLRTGVIASARAPLADTEPGAVVDAVCAIVGGLEDALGPAAGLLAGIGVAVSGDVDTATGIVRESGLMGWTGVDLGKRLQERLSAPVVVENDVRALTIGEHWFGVGVGTASFAIVTIGRGIGSGLHVNGEVVEGAHGVAGEIGHLPLAPPDRLCACGRHGCVEAVAASYAIAAAVSAAHGRELSIEDAAELASEGDPAACDAFHQAGAAIGTAIASLVNLTGPELVIIGGEGVAEFDLFREPLQAAFDEHVFGAAARCRIAVRPHTFEDWARGAAATSIRTLVR